MFKSTVIKTNSTNVYVVKMHTQDKKCSLGKQKYCKKYFGDIATDDHPIMKM